MGEWTKEVFSLCKFVFVLDIRRIMFYVWKRGDFRVLVDKIEYFW